VPIPASSDAELELNQRECMYCVLSFIADEEELRLPAEVSRSREASRAWCVP
jgi:hypothetical protein